MDDIKIIKGNETFYEDFINLILFTGEKIFYSIFGKNVKDILKNLYSKKENQFSYEFTNFIEVQNKICGMLLSYSYDDKKKVELNTGRFLLKIMKIDFLKIFPNLLKSFFVLEKLDKGDYYISNIATYPSFRGMGLGTKLLTFSEDVAKNRKMKRLVLEVEKENKNAIKVYENFGFKKEKDLDLKIEDKTFSFYKMVKNLNN
ncbi:MAG TPA: GNAT family N-acetyltransferase [Caldisericia bacterium]|nr:GNAT family N-acetyltransferase [Caldisericia bacterium]